MVHRWRTARCLSTPLTAAPIMHPRCAVLSPPPLEVVVERGCTPPARAHQLSVQTSHHSVSLTCSYLTGSHCAPHRRTTPRRRTGRSATTPATTLTTHLPAAVARGGARSPCERPCTLRGGRLPRENNTTATTYYKTHTAFIARSAPLVARVTRRSGAGSGAYGGTRSWLVVVTHIGGFTDSGRGRLQRVLLAGCQPCGRRGSG
jgi:hypothetical protein